MIGGCRVYGVCMENMLCWYGKISGMIKRRDGIVRDYLNVIWDLGIIQIA